MKVFISSVITDFEAERAAVQDAIELLGHEVIRAEDFPASSDSPRVACLSGVRASDLVILIASRRYGHVQKDGLSATHEEFREARDTKEVIIFVQDDVDREPLQATFVQEIEDWAAGGLTAHFTSSSQLHRLAVRAISEHEKKRLRGAPNEGEALARAQDLLGEPDRHRSSGNPALSMVIVGSPHQQIVRPRHLESADFEESVSQKALFDRAPWRGVAEAWPRRFPAGAGLVSGPRLAG